MKALAAAVLLAFGLSSALAAQPRHPGVITRPDWVAKPSAADLQAFYPKAAAALELQGDATITCVVEVSGALSGCALGAESPPELGFGPAALRMASLFKMRSMTEGGAPTRGGRVTIPISFRISPRPPAPTPEPQPVDAEALDLARQLVVGIPHMAEILQQGAMLPDDGVTPPATRAAATDALNAVIGARRQDFIDVMARANASVLSRDELQAMVNYVVLGQPLQMPPGETAEQFAAKVAQSSAAERQAFGPLKEQSIAEAQAIFCKTRVCTP
jgi:TonB family protein